jgi:DNA mismatch repair protein MutH
MPLLKEILERLLPHAGKTHTCPKTINKGMAGFLVETLAGIPQTSNCLDCEDGEVKCFPLKRLKNGTLVPKETIAVTMIQPDRLSATAWADSNAYKKLANCLYIPYIRDDDATVTLFAPYIFPIAADTPVYAQLEADYMAIVDHYKEKGSLDSSSSLGVYLQNRTKGAGHGSTSRAFYLRPAFIKKFILSTATAPVAAPVEKLMTPPAAETAARGGAGV